MKILTVCFARKNRYKKLLTVFKKSLHDVMPGMSYEIIKPPLFINNDKNKYRRIKKDVKYAFDIAVNYVLKSKELIAVCDVDLMFLRSIKNIVDKEFDIAITVRNRNKAKCNTGIWFYRPSKRSRLFVKKWMQNTNYLINNFVEKTDFIRSHGGIDQAGLHMTVGNKLDINLLELPCLEWNATQSEWKDLNKKTRVVHIKSKLRLACFDRLDNELLKEILKPIIKKWKGYCNDKKI